MNNMRITSSGLKYIIIYSSVCLLPFFIFLNIAGMTAIIGKTLGYITLPIPLLIWLFNLELFHKYFSLFVGLNIILNFLILLLIGSIVERKKPE